MERFTTARQVREDIELWRNVLDRITSGEMPPRDQKQLEPRERRQVVDWIENLVDQEARRRAGDPGPALVRRINNAEYNYVIRDLTGMDLRPARQFPADGAAGEGFLNATDSLTISPDQMRKYLDAAKDVAAYTVLLPDGIRFSASKASGDWSSDVIAEIVGLYGKYTNEFGQIPFRRYLSALLTHRDRLQAGKTSIAQAASSDVLSPKYLQLLWKMLRDDQTSMFLNEVRASWARCRSEQDLTNLTNKIASLQALLWHKRDPIGKHALDDRYVPPGVSLTRSHTYKLDMPPPAKDGTITFYLSARTFAASEKRAFLTMQNARFEAKNKPPVPLREVLEKTGKSTLEEPSLEVSRLGVHPESKPLGKDDLVMNGSETLAAVVKGSLVAGRKFVVDVAIDPATAPQTISYFDLRLTRAAPRVKQGVAWTDVAGPFDRHFLTTGGAAARGRFEAAADEFRQLFPARVCYPGVVVRDTVVTLERFHRSDAFLSKLLLDDQEKKRLDRLWKELHFISQDALHVRASYATLTQGEFPAYKEVSDEIHRRARETEEALRSSQPKHLDALQKFAAQAYRRRLTKVEQQGLVDLYQSLRRAKLPHDEAFRAVLARVLVSPNFLYRLETPPAGKEAAPVNDWELATRLSFFLWSSIPDSELRRLAAAGTLHDVDVLETQVRRMLKDQRSRALAIEFGAQWLEVRNFDQFQAKNEKLFPAFNVKLRRAMYEESILFFQDMFQADLSIWKLIDADHTFVNKTLARHYGLPGVKGDEFRRVTGAKQHGRGGILGLGSVLSKHSGASRTSPVLRGNWIAEILLGEKLPRPPDDVPKLPEAESTDGLSIRQLVEKHARLPQCAICHRRIDPLGLALEQYDTIGRRRDKDFGGRPIDARARLADGADFEGIEGLRRYLLSKRKDDFKRQFCRKLLGYALGRRVILSDRQLLEEMSRQLAQNDNRVSAAILAIVRSKQFRFIRGAEFGKN